MYGWGTGRALARDRAANSNSKVLKDERKRQQYDSSLRFSGGKHTPYEGAHPFGGGGGFPGGQWEVNEKEFEEWMRHHEATMNEFFKVHH